jgi:hypothetical protein
VTLRNGATATRIAGTLRRGTTRLAGQTVTKGRTLKLRVKKPPLRKGTYAVSIVVIQKTGRSLTAKSTVRVR